MILNHIKENNDHIITFNIDDKIISYDNFLQMIKECKKKYDVEIKKINKDYDNLLFSKDFNKSLEISHKHKNIVLKLIKRVLSYYPIIKTFDFGLFISNSFARGTNLIDSDLDLNFVYEDENYDIGLQIEETVSYALSLIMGKYRDFIHDSIVHRMKLLPKEMIYNSNEKVWFICKWGKKIIKYEITKGNETVMLNHCYGKRNLNSYIKYLGFYINDFEVNEWLYYQTIIYNKKYLNQIFNHLIKKEKQMINIIDYNQILDTLEKKYSLELKEFDAIDFSNMKSFKEYFKNITYNKIFTWIAIQKKINLIDINFKDIYSIYNNLINSEDIVKKYFGNVMVFNYICDLYGIAFRTRYDNTINEGFNLLFKSYIGEDYIIYFKKITNEIYKYILSRIKELKKDIPKKKELTFDPLNEWFNIENYSPFSFINEVSAQYQKTTFLLPFIKYENKIIPVHPDTFDDLKMDRKNIVKEFLVYPTSSYRTVYDPVKNICYKLPLLRKITRSIRNLSNKELKRSEISYKLLSSYKCDCLYILKEICVYNDDENYNYIIRKMPKVKTFPWFYIIASQKFGKDFQLKCIKNIINSWMFFASKGIYFESPHTQNYLVDLDANIYYRDLSDIRNLDFEIMKPSFYNELSCDEEMLSVFFDRAICNQNLDHLVKYCDKLTAQDLNDIKEFIAICIKKYNLSFPDYSMDYSKDTLARIPERTEKVRWR